MNTVLINLTWLEFSIIIGILTLTDVCCFFVLWLWATGRIHLRPCPRFPTPAWVRALMARIFSGRSSRNNNGKVVAVYRVAACQHCSASNVEFIVIDMSKAKKTKMTRRPGNAEPEERPNNTLLPIENGNNTAVV